MILLLLLARVDEAELHYGLSLSCGGWGITTTTVATAKGLLA